LIFLTFNFRFLIGYLYKIKITEMKRISYLLLLTILASLVISSCSNTKTYAEQLNDEKILIADYIKRNNIQIVTTYPADSVWTKNGNDIYYISPASGLYIHMVNYGDMTSKDTLLLKDVVVPRYKQYTLGLVSDTISNWSTIDFPYPSTFVYGDLTQSCKAFQEAASYLKRNETEAKLIVPSKLGFTDNLTSVTPMGYDLKIKIQK